MGKPCRKGGTRQVFPDGRLSEFRQSGKQLLLEDRIRLPVQVWIKRVSRQVGDQLPGFVGKKAEKIEHRSVRVPARIPADPLVIFPPEPLGIFPCFQNGQCVSQDQIRLLPPAWGGEIRMYSRRYPSFTYSL